MPSFIPNPFGVPSATTGITVNVKGVGTTWSSTPPNFTALVGTVTAVTVTNNVVASFTYTSPETDQDEFITDNSTGYIANIKVSSHQRLIDCVNWVSNDVLKRQDIQQQLIDSTVNFYTTLVRRVPFDEFMYTTAEYNVTQNVARYNLIGLDPTIWPPLDAIASIRLTYGPPGSSSVRLRRSAVRLYDSISYSLLPSRPSTYARWGTYIELNPQPDNSQYTFRIRYRGKAVLNSPNPENTIILIDDAWNELIRWECLYRGYYLLGMYEQANQLIQPSSLPRQPSPRRQIVYELGIIPRLWNDLLQTISQKENVDEDFSINPVVRNYSQNNG